MAVIHWFGGLNHKIRGLYRRSSTWKEWEPPAIETSTDMFMTGPRLYGRNISPTAKDLPADVNISLNISANASEYRLCPASRFHSCWYSPWTDPKFQSFQHKIQFQMRSARNLQKSRNNRMFWNLQPVFSFIYIFIYFLSLFFLSLKVEWGGGGRRKRKEGAQKWIIKVDDLWGLWVGVSHVAYCCHRWSIDISVPSFCLTIIKIVEVSQWGTHKS